MARIHAFMDVRRKGNLFTANESPETLKNSRRLLTLRIIPTKSRRSLLRELDAIKSRQWMIRLIVSSEKQLKRMSRSRSPITRKGFMEPDNQNDDDRSRETIQSALAFMKFHLASR